MYIFNFFDLQSKYDRKHLQYLVKIWKINYKFDKIRLLGFYDKEFKQNWRIFNKNMKSLIWKKKKINQIRNSKFIINSQFLKIKQIYWYEHKFFYIKMLKFRIPWPNKKYLNPPKKKKIFSWTLNFFIKKKIWCLISIWSLKDDLVDFYIFLLHDFFFYTNNIITMEGILYFYFIEFIDFSHLID